MSRTSILVAVMLATSAAVLAAPPPETAWLARDGVVYRLTVQDERIVAREAATLDDFQAFSDGVLNGAVRPAEVMDAIVQAFGHMARVDGPGGATWRLAAQQKTNFLRELTHLPLLPPGTEAVPPTLKVTPFPRSGQVVEVTLGAGQVAVRMGDLTTRYADGDGAFARWLEGTAPKR